MRQLPLYQCDRCNLTFGADEPPEQCPACKRYFSGHTVIRKVGWTYGENRIELAPMDLGTHHKGYLHPSLAR